MITVKWLLNFHDINAKIETEEERWYLMDKETKQISELILSKLESIDRRQDIMVKRQDEIYQVSRGLEENAKVTRAEQDKMIHTLGDILAKVNKITGEVEDHDTVIRLLRSIK